MSGEVRRCKKCSVMIKFVKGKNGKMIPLDTQAVTYIIRKDLLNQEFADVAEGAFVSHFNTCPNANDFSGSKK